MNRLQGPAWALGGAGALALALYAAGLLGQATGSGPATDERVKREAGAGESVGVIAIDADTQRRLGIVVAPLTSSSDAATLDGFAKGLDAAPLAAIIAEIDTAEAAAATSTAEARRLEALYRQDVSASRRSVEAARAQAQGDMARVRLAQQRIGIEFGPGLLRLGITQVRLLAGAIAHGEAALVRIDIPSANLAPGTTVSVAAGPATSMVRVLGPAGAADARLQSAGVLAVLRGPIARQSLTGRVLTARIAAGPARTGLLVPRDAIVRFQGQMWVYRQTAKGFFRVALSDPVSVPDGWLIRDGLGLGDHIAVRGGAGLLAIDLGGSGQGQSAEED